MMAKEKMGRKTPGEKMGRLNLAGMPAHQAHKARFLTLFFIWRLKEKPRYAYSLLKEIQGVAMSPSRPSTIYAVLNRLEKAGYVKSREEKVGRRIRRLYSTTPAGWKLFLDIKKKRFKGLLSEFMKALVS